MSPIAELLQAAPPILKLYYTYTKEQGNGSSAKNQGWNVYLDTKDPETLGNYYRWIWTHYEFTEVCSKRELPNEHHNGVWVAAPTAGISRVVTTV